jgi:hypothetical protein
MAKRPDPELIFGEITADSRRIFGEELRSVILYGSGAGRDYLPDQSDLNVLIVVTAAGMERLDQLIEPVKRWRKNSVAMPLLMTSVGFAGSQDAYPIEFLNMQRQYRILAGEDLFAGLTFDRGHVRLQLERELRGKLLHLRSGYLATENKAERIRELIRASLTAFVSLLRALLYLRGAEIPRERQQVIAAAGKLAGVNADLFLQCEAVRKKADSLSDAEVRNLFQAYLREIGRLCETVEAMEL